MKSAIFASTLALASAGGCSDADQANLQDAQVVGQKQNDCGHSALGFTGINHDKFTSCVKDALTISDSCAECYYAVADYGFKNCKAACLLGWCKEGCLSCTQPAQDTLATCAGFTAGAAKPCLSSADEAWEAYKAQYGKVYNGDEDDAKRAQFEINTQYIAEHNAKGESLQLGLNQFTDLTQEEYRVAAGLGYKPTAKQFGSLPHVGVHTYNGETLADEVDWTTKGAVTPVKDQGQCGSCWAFSTTGTLEGAWQISSGSLQSLSEQQFVDCDTGSSAGCQGGDMTTAIQWAEGQGLATESSYPYTATDGSCKTSFTTAIPQGGVTGYKSVDQSTEALKSAINVGPVSVAIEADQMAFQLYSSGILKSGCGTNLDHGVLAVGYGADYFKVKNSWGSSWGEAGYLQISTEGNTCGIHSEAVYPTVSSSVSV